jgi:hypothetical protein
MSVALEKNKQKNKTKTDFTNSLWPYGTPQHLFLRFSLQSIDIARGRCEKNSELFVWKGAVIAITRPNNLCGLSSYKRCLVY